MYEKLDVRGKGVPEYTDEEAAAFAERLNRLNADRDRKLAATLSKPLAELKIDSKKMRGVVLHTGNATDWGAFRLSPNYKLSAVYRQQASEETVFRGVTITRVEQVKPK